MSKKTIYEPMGDNTDLRIEYDYKGNLTASYWVVDIAEPYQTKLVDNLINTTIQNEVETHNKEQSARQRKQSSKNANNAKKEAAKLKKAHVDKWLRQWWWKKGINTMTLHRTKKVNVGRGARDTSPEVDTLTDEIKNQADANYIKLITPDFVREHIKHLRKIFNQPAKD